MKGANKGPSKGGPPILPTAAHPPKKKDVSPGMQVSLNILLFACFNTDAFSSGANDARYSQLCIKLEKCACGRARMCVCVSAGNTMLAWGEEQEHCASRVVCSA